MEVLLYLLHSTYMYLKISDSNWSEHSWEGLVNYLKQRSQICDYIFKIVTYVINEMLHILDKY